MKRRSQSNVQWGLDLVSDNIIDINEYRKAKRFTDDLEQILKIVNLSIAGLSHYSKYTAVNVIISTLQTNRTLLEIHYNKYMRVLEKAKPGEKD